MKRACAWRNIWRKGREQNEQVENRRPVRRLFPGVRGVPNSHPLLCQFFRFTLGVSLTLIFGYLVLKELLLLGLGAIAGHHHRELIPIPLFATEMYEKGLCLEEYLAERQGEE